MYRRCKWILSNKTSNQHHVTRHTDRPKKDATILYAEVTEDNQSF